MSDLLALLLMCLVTFLSSINCSLLFLLLIIGIILALVAFVGGFPRLILA